MAGLVLTACVALGYEKPAASSPALPYFHLPEAIGQVGGAEGTDVRRVLEKAAASLPAGLRETLANKPSPWIVKAHDVGEPTDIHKDIPWHLLDKEKDERFNLPWRGQLGVFNTNADIHWRIGFGLDDQAVTFDPKRRYTDHLVNLAAEEIDLGDVKAHVLFLPVFSDTFLAVVTVRNDGNESHSVRLESHAGKPRQDGRPVDYFDYGTHVTSGAFQWAVPAVGGPVFVACYDEWNRQTDKPAGFLLCALVGTRGQPGTDQQLRSADPAAPPASFVLRLDLAPGQVAHRVMALILHRFGPQRVETRRQLVLYPEESIEQALAYLMGRINGVLRIGGFAWPSLVRDSYRWYERVPMVELPQKNWTADFLCALDLPRGNTWSAQGVLRQPWYTFCRVNGHDPYGWWSYGMHGHEHLSTFVVNITEPTLSQSFLRGHFQVQQPDGFIQYGVNHSGQNVHEGLATCPFLMTEVWTAYTWSGDRTFLEEAYRAGSAYVRWWRSPARTREGQVLQHWRDYLETVRDDKDLATWMATDKAEQQEALDLNCYLLNEERMLGAMARELDRTDEAAGWEADADARAAVMREKLWHAGDGVYYGRDLVGDRWARVMDISTFFPLWCGLATEDQAVGLVRLLHDPQAFGTDYPVATLAVKHMPEKRRGEWHWRGSNWVEMTWPVIQGLRRYGFYDEAARLAEINCRMVFDTLETTGHFREFYNSLTGAPTDLTDYIWTAMPAIMIVETFFGVRPTAAGLEVLPSLPEGWPSIRVSNLRVRDRRLSIHVQRDPAANETRATIDGKPRPILDGRGVFVPWNDLPAACEIEIIQQGDAS